jgi:hypothetical protein
MVAAVCGVPVLQDDPRSPNNSTTEAGQPLTTSDLSHTPAARLESRVAGRDAETTALQARLSDTMSRLAESRNSSSDTGGFGEIVIAHTDNKVRVLTSVVVFKSTPTPPILHRLVLCDRPCAHVIMLPLLARYCSRQTIVRCRVKPSLAVHRKELMDTKRLVPASLPRQPPFTP